jgi:diaminobutyrate-2-oxoglutarate transaminase
MIMLGHADLPVGPRVTGPLPGPRSAELVIKQGRRESNARVHPRHIPIAIDEARRGFVRDLHGSVFIDFLTGAGVLSLGHDHPEARVVAEQGGGVGHGLDLPTATIPWRRNPPRRYAGLRPASTRRRAEAFHGRPVMLLLTQRPQ